MLKKTVAEIISCPKCKNSIEYDKDNNIIICLTCNLKYAIKNGVPVMLIDEANKYKLSVGGTRIGSFA